MGREPETGTIEEHAASRELPPSTLAEPQLFRVVEADRPLAGGSRHSLRDVDVVTIGRGAELAIERKTEGGEVHLEIRVPGRFMSTRHAVLRRGDRIWSVEDAGSKNGTTLNGLKVTRTGLTDGDVLEMGHTFFLFRSGVQTPPDAPLDLRPNEQPVPLGLRTNWPLTALKHSALKKISPSKVPVLLLGPTGTGKEVLARAVHQVSGREGPFIGVNCGALPPSLVESLLFGHMKGAFSGAVTQELGFLRAADGGTLLLDEIGDLPLASQVALLRVLQEDEIVPLGATRPVKVDVRIVAATHRPIDRLAVSGEFRSDLLGRLKGYTHELAPLRDRREDLGILIADILPEVAGPAAESVQLSTDVVRAFLSYSWPLNVRELHQVLRASLLLSNEGRIELTHLPSEVGRPAPAGTSSSASSASGTSRPESRPGDVPSPAAQGEELKQALVERLKAERGNVAAVARAMGKAPFQIHRWMKRFGIDPNSFRDG